MYCIVRLLYCFIIVLLSYCIGIVGDLKSVGRCMDDYWKMKKLMAPGCEPEVVTRIMSSLRPHTLGMCMAGAGGGGFMYVLAKNMEAQKNIKNMVANGEVSFSVNHVS